MRGTCVQGFENISQVVWEGRYDNKNAMFINILQGFP